MKLLGGGGTGGGAPNRCREQTAGSITVHGWSCPQDICQQSVWYEFDLNGGAREKRCLFGTSGSTSLQRVTRHKNTPITAKCYKQHIVTWERRSTWNTMHTITLVNTCNKTCFSSGAVHLPVLMCTKCYILYIMCSVRLESERELHHVGVRRLSSDFFKFLLFYV